MATNNQLNSNFHQIAVADANGVVTGVMLSGNTTLGSISDLTITGGTSGQVMTTDGVGNLSWTTIATGDANFANFAGSVTTNAQPNITSVGNLTDLTVTGNINAPAIVQNASFYDTRIELGSASGIIAVTTNGNTTQFLPSGQINLGGVSKIGGGSFAGSELELATTQTNLKQLRDGNVTVQVGTGGSATDTWTFANTGNLTLPSNTAAINYANGTSIVALVANATYAVTAGTANAVAGANVTGTVANATYATTAGSADSVAGANVTGWVANANIANTATSATTAGTVTTAAQPNITSVGTLTSLDTVGDAIIGGNLTVNGTVTTVHSTEVDIDDKNITLAYNAADAAAANGGGITINGAGATMLYKSADDTWNFNKQIVGNLTGTAANANLATYATTANAVAGANVTGAVALATSATSANSVAGANVSGTVANATYATTAGTANAVAGANVSGTVSAANTAATVTTNAQPNITSTGTLTSLTVSGTSNLGPVGNVTITGGTNGQVLTTNGSNVLSWTTVGGGTLANGTSNVVIPAVNGNVNTSVGGTANVLVVTATGANVTGTMTATGNVTGTRVISTIANGTAPLIVTSTTRVSNLNVANANVADNVGTGTVFGGNYQIAMIFGSYSAMYGNSAFIANANTGTLFANNFTSAANITAGSAMNVKGFTETVTASANTGTAIAPNAITGTIYNFTANNNFTFDGFTSPVAGQSMTVVITQDATGSRIMSSTMKFAGGNKTLSTAPGAIDMLCIMYDGTKYMASLAKGYA